MMFHEDKMPITEDLMREHGLLNRVLLIYEEIINQINKQNLPLNSLVESVNIIKKFIEDYHEKIEEDYIFPLFEKHNKESDLTKTLREQHIAGRKITKQIIDLASITNISLEDQKNISNLLQEFIDMYRPHEAREDTVLFPLVRSLISEEEFNQLSELSEDLEHEIFGDHGFTDILNKVATIEKHLGIYRLDQFTPNK